MRGHAPARQGLNFDLSIAPDMWTETGPDDAPRARLSLMHPHSLCICGLPLHLEAFEVRWRTSGNESVGSANELDDERGEQYFVTDDDGSWGDSADLYNFFGPDAPWCTTTIHGREYVIFASPFGD